MIKLEQVSFRYPTSAKRSLKQATITLREGITTAVMGVSGSGKTTLLNLMGLLWDRPLECGCITYTGEDDIPRFFQKLSTRDKAGLRRQEFGFVFQSAYMLPHFTCAQNIAMPLVIQKQDPQSSRRRVAELLQEADPTGKLGSLQDKLPGEVSGGECQRMSLLRAVIHDPRVLFADEPLSNLDDDNREHMLHLLERWLRGELHASSPRRTRSLVLVTHDTELAHKRADEFIILRRGRVVRSCTLPKAQLPGGPDEILDLMRTGTK